MYVHCEKCLKWHPADALNLEETQIFELIRFKYCRCRRKSSPKCPYSNPNYKSEPELVENGNVVRGLKFDTCRPVESFNSISCMVDEGVVVVNDDPLLHCFGIVEPIGMEAETHLSESVVQNQGKLSIRRPYGKYTTESCPESQCPGR